jgi:hypothetical protein
MEIDPGTDPNALYDRYYRRHLVGDVWSDPQKVQEIIDSRTSLLLSADIPQHIADFHRDIMALQVHLDIISTKEG